MKTIALKLGAGLLLVIFATAAAAPEKVANAVGWPCPKTICPPTPGTR